MIELPAGCVPIAAGVHEYVTVTVAASLFARPQLQEVATRPNIASCSTGRPGSKPWFACQPAKRCHRKRPHTIDSQW